MAYSATFSHQQTYQFRTLAVIDLSGPIAQLGQTALLSEAAPSQLATRQAAHIMCGCVHSQLDLSRKPV
jgi:hypothetical protein